MWYVLQPMDSYFDLYELNKCSYSQEIVIESENKRYQERKNAAIENDVWEYRKQPPESWNAPMPDWMIEKKKNSLLVQTQSLLSQGIAPSPVFTGFSCTIMQITYVYVMLSNKLSFTI